MILDVNITCTLINFRVARIKLITEVIDHSHHQKKKKKYPLPNWRTQILNIYSIEVLWLIEQELCPLHILHPGFPIPRLGIALGC